VICFILQGQRTSFISVFFGIIDRNFVFDGCDVVGEYTDCNSYKQLVEKYSVEKQKALDGTQKIQQELEAINEKIKEIKSEGFFKRRKRSSELKELEAKTENLKQEKRHLIGSYLSFINLYLPHCVHCQYQYCPYENLVKLDYGIWSRRS